MMNSRGRQAESVNATCDTFARIHTDMGADLEQLGGVTVSHWARASRRVPAKARLRSACNRT